MSHIRAFFGSFSFTGFILGLVFFCASLSPSLLPRLYLHGLSLGALGSESSADLIAMIADPINGALWSGPPFPSANWKMMTDERKSGSLQWWPVFGESTTVRFMTQDGFPGPSAIAEWGPLRIIYLQHASDPMTWFSPDLAFKRPAWLARERGRDVSPYFRWLLFFRWPLIFRQRQVSAWDTGIISLRTATSMPGLK